MQIAASVRVLPSLFLSVARILLIKSHTLPGDLLFYVTDLNHKIRYPKNSDSLRAYRLHGSRETRSKQLLYAPRCGGKSGSVSGSRLLDGRPK